jgi:predicted lactoylglutathione lyase
MIEVIIGNSISMTFDTQESADAFVSKAQELLGANTVIKVNRVDKLYDADGKEASVRMVRVSEWPEKATETEPGAV